MKAVKYHGDGTVSVTEVPMPVIGEDEVLIQVKAAGVCGTDIGDFIYQKDFQGIPGHEMCGIVADPGKSSFKKGDRVLVSVHIVCRECEACKAGEVALCPELKVPGASMGIDGGFAEYVKVPIQIVHPMPDDIDFETGCLILDAFATAWGGVDKIDIVPGMKVAVFGAGPIGLLAMLIAASRGAEVIAIEMSKERAEIAREYGAAHIIALKEMDLFETIKDLTGGKGVDAVIQCATAGQAVISGLKILKVHGVMSQVSGTRDVTLDVYDLFNEKEITVKGSHNGNEFQLPEFIRFVQEHPQVAKIITNRYPLTEAPAAFEAAKAHIGIKTVLIP